MAPIAVVVAGLLIGNRGKLFRMSEQVNVDLERFWELIDEVLNAVLFVLIGAEVLVMPYTPRHFLAAIIAIPIVLLARTATVLPFIPRIGWGTVSILIWGGLRGGLAVAMALSLAEGPQRRYDRRHHLRRRLLFDPCPRHHDSQARAARDPVFPARHIT